MSMTGKILFTTTVLAVGVIAYEAWIIAGRKAAQRSLTEEVAALRRELGALRSRSVGGAESPARPSTDGLGQNDPLAAATAEPALESALDIWLQGVARLRRRLKERPEENIPELQLLTSKDWLEAAQEGKLETEMDLRRALSQLRSSAKRRFSTELISALKRYADANEGRPPADALQLAPFFTVPRDPAILERYGPPTPSQLARLPPMIGLGGLPDGWTLIEKTPADGYCDTVYFYSQRGGLGVREISPYGDEVNAAIKAFETTNHGTRPVTSTQLAPYLRSPIDPAFVQKRINGDG